MGTTLRKHRDLADYRGLLWGEGDDHPMYYVSWFDAQEFIMRLNLMTGKNFRLPTEAEWEYAARGGNRSENYRYAGCNKVEEVAWMEYNSRNSTHPAGQKKPNELGLYDMSGNVWEWCSDWYGDYHSSPQHNPKGPRVGFLRVLRGGSWLNNEEYSRVSIRGNDNPGRRDYCYGFRLVHE